MDLVQEIRDAKLSKKTEVFVTTHTNENGEVVPLGIKVQNRYPAVGLALKEAVEKLQLS